MRKDCTNKAIFVDRDWTINRDFWYVYKIENLEILDWVKEWLAQLKKMWYRIILITNQSWIWRWYFMQEDCDKFNAELENQLWIKFDGIYICPHTPEDGCECRKPKIENIRKAIKDFELDITQCYMIWDKESDIQMWRNAWCKTVLIKDSQYECKIEPNYSVSTIFEFSELIK